MMTSMTLATLATVATVATKFNNNYYRRKNA